MNDLFTASTASVWGMPPGSGPRWAAPSMPAKDKLADQWRREAGRL